MERDTINKSSWEKQSFFSCGSTNCDFSHWVNRTITHTNIYLLYPFPHFQFTTQLLHTSSNSAMIFFFIFHLTYLMQPPKIGSRKKKSVNARPLIPLCLGPFSSLPCHINCYILARPEPKSEIISLALTYWETFSSINGSIHNMKSYCCSQLYWLTDDYFCITLLVLYVLL